MLQTLSVSLLPALVIIAAVIDVTYYKIPNWLTGLTAALFFPMALLTGMPLVEFGWHVLAGAVLFFVGFLIFNLGLFGGGDAKLMAAAGLWMGTAHSLEFLILTALTGGVMALALTGWSFGAKLWSYYSADLKPQLAHIAPKLPYGFALCVGAILTFPNTWWMTVG